MNIETCKHCHKEIVLADGSDPGAPIWVRPDGRADDWISCPRRVPGLVQTRHERFIPAMDDTAALTRWLDAP